MKELFTEYAIKGEAGFKTNPLIVGDEIFTEIARSIPTKKDGSIKKIQTLLQREGMA